MYGMLKRPNRFAIAGGTVVTEHSVLKHGIVVINDRKIEAVTADEDSLSAVDETIDATGRIVLPGAIDPHVHLETPGWSYREDFTTGTCAAAAGGVTMVVEHPINDPPTTTVDRFRDKISIVAQQAVVDVGLWGALTPESITAMEGQAALGAAGFKAFMCGSSEYYPASDDATIAAGMTVARRVGRPVLVHAENDSMLRAGMARMTAEGRTDSRAHQESRPPLAEEEAVHRACFLAESHGTRLYVVHVSSPRSVEIAARARTRGLEVSLEVTPHHLLLDTDDVERIGGLARCAPPVRHREVVSNLWHHVLDGTIDCLGTDHAPYTLEEKLAGGSNIFGAPCGIQGLQEGVALLISEAVLSRGMAWTDFAQLTATRISKIIGLYPRKGVLAPGADADVAIWRVPEQWTVEAQTQQLGKNPWSPYEGRQINARLERTIARGRTVWHDGQITAAPGDGRFVPIPST